MDVLCASLGGKEEEPEVGGGEVLNWAVGFVLEGGWVGGMLV